jgi:hypothetical protein
MGSIASFAQPPAVSEIGGALDVMACQSIAANSTASNIHGSSFSGVLTFVEIGQTHPHAPWWRVAPNVNRSAAGTIADVKTCLRK